MLHPALYKLIFTQGRATARRMLRGGNSPGRIVVFLIGAGIVGIWLFSAIMTIRVGKPTDPNRVRAVMPLALLGICAITAITSAGDKAIAFTPGEVDQLFPGPFTRRELLGYKLLKSTLANVLTAIVLSIIMLRHARWWPASFAGVFLALLFVQWFSIVLLLAGQALGAAAYSRFRKFVIVVACALFLFGIRNWMGHGAGSGFVSAVMEFHASSAGRAIFAPFEPFGQVTTATNATAIVKWGVLAVVLDAGLVVLIFLLDAHYLETAMAASERRYTKIQRVRAGSFLSFGVGKTARWHLPQLPWAGGAGPIAWRQLTNAARSSRGLLLLLVIVAIGGAPALHMAANGGKVFDLLFGVLGWLTFLCSSMLNFDFRGDIDHMDTLKALPLRGSAIAIGQLIAPVLVLTAFHLLMLGIAATVIHVHRDWLLVAMVLVLPLNAVLFEAENLIFLLFPSRPAAVSPGDFQVLGRKFVFLLLKMMIVLTGVMIAGIFGYFAFILGGNNLPLATGVAALILATEAAGLIGPIAWAFRRFDPSIHTPA